MGSDYLTTSVNTQTRPLSRTVETRVRFPRQTNRVIKGWVPFRCVEGATGHRAPKYWRTRGETMYEPPHVQRL
jgi:hypothetical protein